MSIEKSMLEEINSQIAKCNFRIYKAEKVLHAENVSKELLLDLKCYAESKEATNE